MELGCEEAKEEEACWVEAARGHRQAVALRIVVRSLSMKYGACRISNDQRPKIMSDVDG